MSLVGSNDDHLIVGMIPTILIGAVALAPWDLFLERTPQPWPARLVN
jgi:hypothetical protein